MRVGIFLAALLFLCCPASSQTEDEFKATVSKFDQLVEQGDYGQALPLAAEALEQALSIYGEVSPQSSQMSFALARLLHLHELNEEAEHYFKLSLSIDERLYEPSHSEILGSLGGLADFYESLGRYPEELPMRQRLASALVEKNVETETLAQAFQQLGECYQGLGDYNNAIDCFRRSLGILEDGRLIDTEGAGAVMHSLSILYSSIGDYEAALPLHQRAVAIAERDLEPDDPRLGIALQSLALLYHKAGATEEAIPLAKRALAISEKRFGVDVRTSAAWGTLGILYQSLDRPEEARDCHQKSLEINKEALPSGHPDLAASYENLAVMETVLGDFTSAARNYSRSLAIYEEAYGKSHPRVAANLRNLTGMHILDGNREEALRLERRTATSILDESQNIFCFASERQRLAFLNEREPFFLFATMGSAPDVAQALLRYKGTVLDSMVEDSRLAESIKDEGIRALALELSEVKSRMNDLLFGGASVSSSAELQQLRGRFELLSQEITRHTSASIALREAFKLTPQDVQSSLPPGAVFVDFVRYRHFEGENQARRYGAVIQTRGELKWVQLGYANEVDELLDCYQAFTRGGSIDAEALRFALNPAPESDVEVSAKRLLQKLYDEVWSPIQAELPRGTEVVIISPDSQLNFLSFATLLDKQGRFLAQSCNILYVGSGRDLVSEPESSPGGEIVLVGAPTFLRDLKSGSGTSTGPLFFAELPHSRDEVTVLKGFFETKGRTVHALLGDEATELAVRNASGPEILHIATHGYFLQEEQEGQLDDPMYRSGLALSGAQDSLYARAKGAARETDTDGLLTAAEVGTMNLRGTRLVTLSACDTGLGKSTRGQGVLGLRRGFVYAGAQNLLLTLWPVSDKETSTFMQEFYARAETKEPAIALAQAQRDWLIELKDSRSLGEAVRTAGPFVLSFQGKVAEI